MWITGVIIMPNHNSGPRTFVVDISGWALATTDFIESRMFVQAYLFAMVAAKSFPGTDTGIFYCHIN